MATTIDYKGASEACQVTSENLLREFMNGPTPYDQLQAMIKTLNWAVNATTSLDEFRRREQEKRRVAIMADVKAKDAQNATKPEPGQ